MFRFGLYALDVFKSRLAEWPQYCSHIVQIDHLNEKYPELVEEIRVAMTSRASANDGQEEPERGRPLTTEQRDAEPSSVDFGGSLQTRPAQTVPVPKGNGTGPAPPGSQSLTATPHPLDQLAEPVTERFTPPGRGLLLELIMPDGSEPPPVLNPPDEVSQKVHLACNNVSSSNVEQKASELTGIVKPEFLGWFGTYLVNKRLSTQANFHPVYLALLGKMDNRELDTYILASVFHHVSLLLAKGTITTSTQDRSLLKNLGSWLGQMTLGRNKPILQRHLDVKELLCQGYETGRLIAVTPFVAKILEAAKDSRVFRPPNPWTMSLMGILRELYDLEDLKMNLKFEIEVLCKNLDMKLDDAPLREVLKHRLQPRKEKTPDFNVRSPPPSENAAASPVPDAEPPAAAESTSADGTDQTVIPNLAAYVNVNARLPLFVQHPQLKASVAVAVDRAIREIIQPVVERSVTIACITTKELIVKDFAMESSEQKMRKAAQLMVSNLAGSLAVVTCKEPLRLSMANYLHTLFQPANAESSVVDQAVQVLLFVFC